MPTPRPTWQRRSVRAGKILRLGSLLAGCALAPGLVRAAPETVVASQIHELSESLSNELGKLRPLLEAEKPDFKALIAKVDAIIIAQKLTGYDLAYVKKLKANLYISSGEPFKATSLIEDSLVGDYFSKPETSGLTLALATLYMQEGGLTSDEKLREKRLAQSRVTLEKWFAGTKEPLLGSPEMESYSDAVSLYANALYYLKEYKLSYETSKKLVRLAIEPKDQAWILLFAAQQESGENAAAAETFEMFIRKFPDKKEYWVNLAQAYLNSDQTLRAILTYQRAQSFGFMNTANDYLNVFGLYCRLEEFSRAAQLLEGWITSGKVPSTEDNWENVSSCYANLRRDDQVRAILDKSRKQFKTGSLDYMLAQYLWYDGKYKEGLEAAELAWKKGGMKKAGKAALFLATANFEQRNFERAKMFFGLAEKSGDVSATDLDRARKFVMQDQEPTTPPAPAAAGAAKAGA